VAATGPEKSIGTFFPGMPAQNIFRALQPFFRKGYLFYQSLQNIAMKKNRLFPAAFLLLGFLLMVSSCKEDRQPLPDPAPSGVLIGGKNYPTVTIGNQEWTAVNYSGPGGIPYNTPIERPEYGRYYTLAEAKAVVLPPGWRIPTQKDYEELARAQGIVLTNHRATNQEAIKKLASKEHWRKISGTNASGFNAYPAGYCFQDALPQDGNLSEFWTSEGLTLCIMEGANGLYHNMSFYAQGNGEGYRFNLRFVRD
jgi:uncharacterized protein (TIGR02145 family)